MCIPEIPSLNRAKQESTEASLRLLGEILSQINKNRSIQKLEVISMRKERMGEKLLFALALTLLIEPGRLEMKKVRAIISKINYRKTREKSHLKVACNSQ